MSKAVSFLHVLVIAPGLLLLASLTVPPPAWARLALVLVAIFALIKHLPHILKETKKEKDAAALLFANA